jgi:hypothetical protein
MSTRREDPKGLREITAKHGAVTHMDARANRQTSSLDSASGRAADAALVDRIRLLRAVLPAIASDLANAKREIRQLRRENARLKQRVTRYQGGSTRTL